MNVPRGTCAASLSISVQPLPQLSGCYLSAMMETTVLCALTIGKELTDYTSIAQPHWLHTNMFVVHACACTSLVRLPRYDSVSCRPYSVPARPYITGKRYARQCNLQSQHPNFANAISVGYCPVDALVRRRLRHLPLHSRL